ncbi:MAG: HTH-type transcriptional activator CmpR [Paracidovorax wautersii]|uniref:HTH-type transcriptional activator CmpR n=1 Tax=Paracidovorax wautersii TaxID=1177982 RepID=A0A7V8JNQ6_9BURK|nr:MAG: HTH-type transcriptional activator CmpR [Paracidovorax wautersii]
MQITDLNLSTRQIRAFLALAKHRNFTLAARQCHLSQSAFSTLIRTLEEALSMRLFDRDTRKVELTPEGRLFEAGAQRLLEDFRGVLQDLGDHAARRRGRVAMAALPSLAAGWLPPVLASFRASYPGIELGLSDALSEGCVEQVRTGQADFALAAKRPGAPELQIEAFCCDRFHLVCRIDHRLAPRRRIPLESLAQEPFIHLARSSSVRQHIEAAIQPTQLNAVMELEQLSTVAGMIRAGLGVTVVPTLALFHFEHPELVTRTIQAPHLRRELFVIRRSDRSLSLAAQTLLDHLIAHKPPMR